MEFQGKNWSKFSIFPVEENWDIANIVTVKDNRN
jgi:hypothetical protein